MKFRLKTYLSLASAMVFCAVAAAQAVDYGEDFGVLSFENGVCDVKAGKHSCVKVSPLHYKLGSHSLEWTWKRSGEKLTIPGHIPYLKQNPNPKETSISTFVFWVYADRAMEGSLRFSFRKEGRECCHFDYGLGFTGWRGAWVAFVRDMEGCPEEGMDEIVISAPSGVRRGSLWLDGVIRSAFEDARYHTPDFQAPFINEGTDIHWLVLNKSWNLRLDVPQQPLEASDIEDIELVTGRFVSLVTPAKTPKIKDLRKMFEGYGIKENPDGTVTGKPVWFTRYGETFLNLGIPDASASFRKNGQLLRAYNDNLLNLASAWTRTVDASEKEELARMYVMMTRHLLDQGFAAGSAQGTLHHLGYSMRNFYIAPVLMRDVLRKAGLSSEVQKAMEWFSGVGEVKTAPTEPGMDIDAFNTSLMGRMASILMLEDSPYKWAYLKALSRWIDNGFKYVDGTMPCFKSDGSIYHHRKAYPAYAVGGLDGAVNSVWMLRGTALAVSQESHEILRHALLEMRFWCNLRSFPLAMSGRHPDGKGELIPRHYAMLADAGTPDGKSLIDREIASAYLRLVPDERPKEKGWIEKFAAVSLLPETNPQGSRSYGYNCSLSHRCGESLVTFAGHSRYLWAAEIYRGANHYGRYLTHGSMQILCGGAPVIDSFGSGFQVEGWDWCHIPGTTAAQIPMERMKANVLNVDEHSGYEEMLLSDEWFAGGVSHKGLYGAFAMKLHEHDKYNGSLRARKSFFAFGDRIVALGSDLENHLQGSELHTTLFQNTVNENLPTFVNGGDVSRDDYSAECDAPLTVLKDRFGNAYFVRDARVRVSRGIQHSLHEEADAPTEGLFERAYIFHGTIVGRGAVAGDIYMKDDYEYMVGLNPSDERMDSWSANLPYRVVRKDRSAHIVRDHESGVTACAVFEPGAVDSLILESSAAMIMYSGDTHRLTLSVCNPDLALYEGEADELFDENGKRIERSVYGRSWIDSHCRPTEVKLKLKGLWEVSDGATCVVEDSREDNCTTLVFHTGEARSEELVLERVLL